ncbi:hypothetical protein AHAS_Ahas05G0223700 [Arachis hypogaea]
MFEIVLDPKNLFIEQALKALDDHCVHRNQPRNKRKEVKTLFTAPRIKIMLQRAGLPMKTPCKGERQEKKKDAYNIHDNVYMGCRHGLRHF